MSDLQENLPYPLLNMCRKFYTLELIGNLVFLLVVLLDAVQHWIVMVHFLFLMRNYNYSVSVTLALHLYAAGGGRINTLHTHCECAQYLSHKQDL